MPTPLIKSREDGLKHEVSRDVVVAGPFLERLAEGQELRLEVLGSVANATQRKVKGLMSRKTSTQKPEGPKRLARKPPVSAGSSAWARLAPRASKPSRDHFLIRSSSRNLAHA